MTDTVRRVVVAMVSAAALGACSASTPQAAPAPAPASSVAPTSAAPAPTTTSTTVAGPSVQRPEPPLPTAVQETAGAATADHFYVIAGYDPNQNSTSGVFVFDGSKWSTGPTFPVALNHPSAAALDGAVYEAGGFGSNGPTNRAFVLVPGGDQWREIAPMNHARGAAVLEPFDHHLFAIGGRAGNTQIATPERYDPTTNHWSDLPDMPHPRNHLSGYVDGGLVCVAGGREPSTSTRTDCFDPASSMWSPGPALPTPTSGAAAGVVGGVLVVAGGEPSDETSLVKTLQEWHGTWASEPMLTPRHGTAYAMLGGRLWMCGGATAPGVQASTTCTSYGPG